MRWTGSTAWQVLAGLLQAEMKWGCSLGNSALARLAWVWTSPQFGGMLNSYDSLHWRVDFCVKFGQCQLQSKWIPYMDLILTILGWVFSQEWHVWMLLALIYGRSFPFVDTVLGWVFNKKWHMSMLSVLTSRQSHIHLWIQFSVGSSVNNSVHEWFLCKLHQFMADQFHLWIQFSVGSSVNNSVHEWYLCKFHGRSVPFVDSVLSGVFSKQ